MAKILLNLTTFKTTVCVKIQEFLVSVGFGANGAQPAVEKSVALGQGTELALLR